LNYNININIKRKNTSHYNLCATESQDIFVVEACIAIMFTCHCIIYKQDESCSSYCLCDFGRGTLSI